MALTRKLISKYERKISILQIIGFTLILLGVTYYVGRVLFDLINMRRIPPPNITAEEVSLVFFITMLGFSLAFPDLLKDENKGLSTMRLVVFMMINVICMLLLKIGWDKDNFTLIGINQYWVGIIAFVFGAKAVQSFFESKMAVPVETAKTGVAAIEFTNADIAKLAVEQNQQFLKVKFPNILSISDAVHDLNSTETHVIAIYLKNNNTVGIPDILEAQMPDGTKQTISTEIIKDVGSGGININQRDEIRNGRDHGSVCCIVSTEDGLKVATAGHVFSKGDPKNYGGELDVTDQTQAQINKSVIGNWFFQAIDFKNDIALASIDNIQKDKVCVSFEGKTHYEIKDNDVKKTQVKVISNIFQPKERAAYILDYNTAWDVRYKSEIVTKNNIIVIGDNPDRNKSNTVSMEGDSGGCVFEPISGNLIGLILGGNSKFTWVLPLKDIFEEFDYKIS